MDPLLQVLTHPERMPGLSAADWDTVMRRARPRALLAKLAEYAQQAGVFSQLPDAVQRQMQGMLLMVTQNNLHIRWEADRILAACGDLDVPVIFLKGAGYLLAGLPMTAGRISSDTDIMVPRGRLDEVEAVLKNAGWLPIKTSTYDDMYYRRWMHELPPLRHRRRQTVVDLHHTILPLTGRITPNANAMFADAVPLTDGGFVLSPADMLVHCAVHLFQDGDLNQRLRELIDFRELLQTFAADAGFADQFLQRTALHGAEKPVWYSLHFMQVVLQVEVPSALRSFFAGNKPNVLPRGLMNSLVPAALVPSLYNDTAWGPRFKRFCLFIRSHWLRMPPLMLARHLLTKVWMRLTGK